MHPILFQIGHFTLRSYAACLAIAGIVPVLFLRPLVRPLLRGGRDDFWLLANMIWISAFLGARVFFFVVYRPMLPPGQGSGSFLLSSSEGLSTFGAIAGALAGATAFCLVRRLDPWPVLDRVAIALPIGHACARVGCFLAGCCFGKAADRSILWAVTFTDPQSAVPVFLRRTPLHPTQLYEAAGDFLIAALCYGIAFRRMRRGLWRPGSVLACALIGYGLLRFAVDPYRADSHRLSWLAFSTDQSLALAIILLASVFAVLNKNDASIQES